MWSTGWGKCLESGTNSRRSVDALEAHQGCNIRKRISKREIGLVMISRYIFDCITHYVQMELQCRSNGLQWDRLEVHEIKLTVVILIPGNLTHCVT